MVPHISVDGDEFRVHSAPFECEHLDNQLSARLERPQVFDQALRHCRCFGPYQFGKVSKQRRMIAASAVSADGPGKFADVAWGDQRQRQTV